MTTELAGQGPVDRGVRPAVPKRGLVERLRDDAQGEDLGADGMGWSPAPALKREAADELVRLHGQMETLGRWIVEALKVLDTIDPDDMEESEQLLTLIKGGEMLSMSALAPKLRAVPALRGV